MKQHILIIPTNKFYTVLAQESQGNIHVWQCIRFGEEYIIAYDFALNIFKLVPATLPYNSNYLIQLNYLIDKLETYDSDDVLIF